MTSAFCRASPRGIRFEPACLRAKRSRKTACSVRFASKNVDDSVETRLVATGTARLASRTCTTPPEYFGAIFTAVCFRLVVAPPISSGIFNPRSSINSATIIICSRLGVISPERPTISAPISTALSTIFSAGHITPRSITSKPLHARTTPTMFLPIS